MNFKRYHVSRNLFDKSTVTHGYYISDSNGNMNTNSTYEQEVNASDYIPINGDSVTIYSNPVGKWRWGAFYDSNKTYISGISGYNKTITIPENARYMRLTVVDDILDTLMVNLGSSPLPYEPYSSEAWHDTPHYVHNTSTDTITTLPANIYPNAATATVGLKGNMVQNGTASPTTPIQPSETGERTGNLLNKTEPPQQIYVTATATRYGYAVSLPSGTYTVSGGNNIIFAKTKVGATYGSATDISIARNLILNEDGYILIYALTADLFDGMNIMLNVGSTALPYEPFGVKIPISSASTTTPIYLGEVQTTRQIKKLVLTGHENWNRDGVSSDITRYRIGLNDAYKSSGTYNTQFYISHYKIVAGGYTDNTCFLYNSNVALLYVCVDINAYPLPDDFKAYLAQQYAAGTPVCVWYVLSTPQTAVVNEPIRKIGEYADTLSNVSIPVTAGGDTLSIGTTLQPSEVTATYKGWHPVADVHEKSKNLFDAFTIIGKVPSVTNGELVNLSEGATTDFIPIGNPVITMSYNQSLSRYMFLYDAQKNFIGYIQVIVSGSDCSNVITNYELAKYVRIRVDKLSAYINSPRLMLNAGSQALPYEPYWT